MIAVADTVWTEMDHVGPDALLAVPVGSTEQHGPHLPLGTDTLLAVELSNRLAARVPEVLVAPAITFGASGEHEGFPGTLSIGTMVLESLAVELARSASRWVQRIIFVNGHGGNVDALARAESRLRSEGRDVLVWTARWRAPRAHRDVVPDAHAGRTETSLVLALRPDLVRTRVATAGVTTPLRELWPQLRGTGVRAVSPNGVLGDPSGATAELGAALVDEATAHLIATVAEWPRDRPATIGSSTRTNVGVSRTEVET